MEEKLHLQKLKKREKLTLFRLAKNYEVILIICRQRRHYLVSDMMINPVVSTRIHIEGK